MGPGISPVKLPPVGKSLAQNAVGSCYLQGDEILHRCEGGEGIIGPVHGTNPTRVVCSISASWHVPGSGYLWPSVTAVVGR